MTVVFEWLERIGLGYAVPLFRERGINTPLALMNITEEDFEAAGIHSAGDRKRLIELVERVKQAARANAEEAAKKRVGPRDEEAESDEDGSPSASLAQTRRRSLRHDEGTKPGNPRDRDDGGAVRPAAATAAPPPPPPPQVPPPGTGAVGDRIRVVVRKRPMNGRERATTRDIVDVRDRSIRVHAPRAKVDLTEYVEAHDFMFDDVFDQRCSNADVYAGTARELVSTVFQGGKATCFAYGQTGSGKTHTMMGPSGARSPRQYGIYLQAARDIFALLRRPEYSHMVAETSFYEIYGGRIFDLLHERKRLRCLEDQRNNRGVCIMGLTAHHASTSDELVRLIDHGNAARSTGTTGANMDSSRSHGVLQIVLRNRHKGRTHGKFSFIDLAGSERGADTTTSDRQTRLEGAEINKSLLALKECIRAMFQMHNYKPFRGSKLTQVLKDSFTGPNSRTVMIATVSPNQSNCEHTLNTLRYAYRVKEIRPDPAHAQPPAGVDADAALGRLQPSVAPPPPATPPPAGAHLSHVRGSAESRRSTPGSGADGRTPPRRSRSRPPPPRHSPREGGVAAYQGKLDGVDSGGEDADDGSPAATILRRNGGYEDSGRRLRGLVRGAAADDGERVHPRGTPPRRKRGVSVGASLRRPRAAGEEEEDKEAAAVVEGSGGSRRASGGMHARKGVRIHPSPVEPPRVWAERAASASPKDVDAAPEAAATLRVLRGSRGQGGTPPRPTRHVASPAASSPPPPPPPPPPPSAPSNGTGADDFVVRSSSGATPDDDTSSSSSSSSSDSSHAQGHGQDNTVVNGPMVPQQQENVEEDEEDEEDEEGGATQWADQRRLPGERPRRQRRRRSAGEAKGAADAGTRREVARLLESTRSSLSDGSDGEAALQGNRRSSPASRRRSAESSDADNARLRRWQQERGVGLQGPGAASSPTTAQGAASAAQLREVLGSPSTRRRRRQHLKHARQPEAGASQGPAAEAATLEVGGEAWVDLDESAEGEDARVAPAARNGTGAGEEAEGEVAQGEDGEGGDGWDIWQQAAEVATVVTKDKRGGGGRRGPAPPRPEDALVNAHREQMHVMMEMVTKEMSLLEEMDNPRADGAAYAEALAAVMDRKQGAIDRLRNQIGAYCDAVARRAGVSIDE